MLFSFFASLSAGGRRCDHNSRGARDRHAQAAGVGFVEPCLSDDEIVPLLEYLFPRHVWRQASGGRPIARGLLLEWYRSADQTGHENINWLEARGVGPRRRRRSRRRVVAVGSRRSSSVAAMDGGGRVVPSSLVAAVGGAVESRRHLPWRETGVAGLWRVSRSGISLVSTVGEAKLAGRTEARRMIPNAWLLARTRKCSIRLTVVREEWLGAGELWLSFSFPLLPSPSRPQFLHLMLFLKATSLRHGPNAEAQEVQVDWTPRTAAARRERGDWTSRTAAARHDSPPSPLSCERAVARDGGGGGSGAPAAAPPPESVELSVAVARPETAQGEARLETAQGEAPYVGGIIGIICGDIGRSS